PTEFYRKLPNATTHPTTSQPSPGRFAEAYTQLLSSHSQVVSIHISEKLSGTYASAMQGAEMTDPTRVHVVDSQLVSMSLGLLTLAATEMVAKGADAEAVVKKMSAMRDQVQTYFSVATLEFLRRGGRIGRASRAGSGRGRLLSGRPAAPWNQARRQRTEPGVTDLPTRASTASACRCASPSCRASRFS